MAFYPAARFRNFTEIEGGFNAIAANNNPKNRFCLPKQKYFSK
jgi:hypothetical protein